MITVTKSGSEKRVYKEKGFSLARSYLGREEWRLAITAYLGNYLIKSVLKPFERDTEILLLNFLTYLQITRRYL